jgi:hypothetical protein
MSQANYLMNCASSWPMRAKNSPGVGGFARLLRTPTKAAARRHGAKQISCAVSRMSRGDDRWPSCSHETRRGGSQPTSPSCPNYLAERKADQF